MGRLLYSILIGAFLLGVSGCRVVHVKAEPQPAGSQEASVGQTSDLKETQTPENPQIAQEPKVADKEPQAVKVLNDAPLFDKMQEKRNAYFRALNNLESYYSTVGNNMKLGWVRKEISILGSLPSYDYVWGIKNRARLSKLIAQAGSSGLTYGFNEVDLVEDMVAKRKEYYNALKDLGDYYKSANADRRLSMLNKELKVLGSVSQYNYLESSTISRTDYVAADSIEEADEIYYEAQRLDSKGRLLGVAFKKTMLRAALAKYNELIKKYPTSDKADDAAYKAAEIYKYFGDYYPAAIYYQRAFEWNEYTTYPARFKAAWILDTKLDKKSEALELYKQSILLEKRFSDNIDVAKARVKTLSKSPQDVSIDVNSSDDN